MEYVSSFDTVTHLINLIQNKNGGSYIRFGDGDFYLMKGQNDLLATPSIEMMECYKLLMGYLKSTDMISINFFCKSLNTLEIGMKPGVHECPDHIALDFISRICSFIPNLNRLYSSVALHQTLVHNPELYVRFLKAIIANNSTIVIGNKDFEREKIKFYFGNNIYIGGNSNNSFNERERIWSEFSNILDSLNSFTVCILALGCGGRAMSYKFIEDIKSKNKNVLIIDIGSSIDVLMGQRDTRAWVEMTNPNMTSIDTALLDNIPNLTLTQLGSKYKTDKATYHNFTLIYEQLFSLIRHNVKSFIEIGIAGGASIKMWRDYFKNAKIYCSDFNLECGSYVSNLPNVFFSRADQDSKESLKNSINKDISLNSVDIIIDDGGHFSTQQRNTLEVFWPYLKSGGFYIVEDIHTNIKHWYPTESGWNQFNEHKKYWDESPTLFESLSKIQLGLSLNSNELLIPVNEVKQVIVWTQPETTSAIVILIKK